MQQVLDGKPFSLITSTATQGGGQEITCLAGEPPPGFCQGLRPRQKLSTEYCLICRACQGPTWLHGLGGDAAVV